MRIFVTGGTGFVGSHLVKRLVANSHDVTVLTRYPKEHRCTSGVHFTNLIPDFEEGGYEMIYHLAGVLGKKGQTLEDLFPATTGIMSAIIERANPYIPTVVMSTAYVESPTSHWKYTFAKKELEKMACNYFSNLTIVRPGPIFGPGDLHHMPLFKMIRRFGWWTPVMGGGNRLSPTHVADVVYWLEPERINPGLLTIAGEAVTIKDFMEEIAVAENVGKPFLKFPVVAKKDFFGVERVFKSSVPVSLNWKDAVHDAAKWYYKEGLVT